jgi:hypothetical protein
MAAGQGFKTFTTGEVLTAGDVNGYLMQGINVFATTAARDAAITAPAEGQFAFTKDTNGLWYYDGAAWVASGATGDIEGVTAGVGISGGGTSGTVTVTNSMATAIDAKGDLVAGTGADAFSRLGVGANNTVLTADSAQATGLKWAAPAAATPSFSLITSGALSGSSTSYTGLSGYNSFMVIIDNLSTDSTAGNNITVTFNSDTASNYAYSGLLLSYSGTTLSTSGRRSAGTTSIPMGRTTNDIGNILCASFTIEAANSTGIKTGQINSGTYNNTDLAQSNILGYRYSGTSVISSIQVITGAGSFDAGTVYIYGSVA